MKATLEFDMDREEVLFRQVLNSRVRGDTLRSVENSLKSWKHNGHEFKSADDLIDQLLFLIERNFTIQLVVDDQNESHT